MSSSKTRNILLATFVVLTLVFGSLSIYDFFQIQQLKSSGSTTLFTNSLLENITVTASVPTVHDVGSIYFSGIGYFQYKRLSDLPVGTSVMFWNVTFYSVSLNFTSSGCTIYNITVSFPDGTSEQIGVEYCPTGGSDVVFTNHSNPKAGVILQGPYNDSFIALGFYLLVQGRISS